MRRGAYVLADAADGKPEVILIGTGSEVALCVEAYEELKREGIAARVVSMPSWELFEQQDQAYRDQRSAAGHHGAGVGRDGLGDRLGPLCRSRRRQDRHAHIRLLGAAQGPAHEFRLHAGECARSREGQIARSKGNGIMNVHIRPRPLNPLERLHEFGQAVWLDFLARRFIAEGELRGSSSRTG